MVVGLAVAMSPRIRRIVVGSVALLLAAILFFWPTPPPPSQTETLSEQLRSHDPAVRELAISSIKQQHYVSADLVEPLKLALRDDDPEVRISAAQALGHMGASGREHLNSLAEICQAEQDPRVQAAIRKSMTRIAKAKR